MSFTRTQIDGGMQRMSFILDYIDIGSTRPKMVEGGIMQELLSKLTLVQVPKSN
ncbi:hypothetical protein ACVBIL_14185 [Shewanella sp. 125m-7]